MVINIWSCHEFHHISSDSGSDLYMFIVWCRYIAALENATWYAGIQGYKGARWGKESGPQLDLVMENDCFNSRIVCFYARC